MATGNSHYYQQMKLLAQEKREQYNIETSKINLNVVRRIYKAEGVTIDYWDVKGNKIKACYFADGEPSVAVKRSLPREPKLFALMHELKHHYVDHESILEGRYECGQYNENEVVEIGAEVFAAAFIYPDTEMLAHIADLGITKDSFTPETIVRFKRSCGAVVSYAFLVKRFEQFGYIEKGEYKGIQFQKLEEQIFGLPVYKRPSYQKNRKRVSKNP
jgi:Zn-dependent peptidase ImmA (M78 family)